MGVAADRQAADRPRPVTPAPDGAVRAAAARAAVAILRWSEQRQDAGHDPYDGLAARLPGTGLLKRSRAGRLALIQGVKRSPLDLRPLLRVPALVNPKTLGLLQATCADLFSFSGDKSFATRAQQLGQRIDAAACSGWSGDCWGYPFDWQARAFFLPRDTPTGVCTAFVVDGLLATTDVAPEAARARLAGAARFVSRDLNRLETDNGPAFSYSPLDHRLVHNASALAARLLVQHGVAGDDEQALELGQQAFRSLARAQHVDGSWVYGTASHHRWIDGFHTAYVLMALASAVDATEDPELEDSLQRGLGYYRTHLLRDGWWPLDAPGRDERPSQAHTIGTTLLAMTTLSPWWPGSLEAAAHLAGDVMERAFDAQTLFPDRIPRRGRIRASRPGFLRWSLAWMARGLAASSKRVPPGS